MNRHTLTAALAAALVGVTVYALLMYLGPPCHTWRPP